MSMQKPDIKAVLAEIKAAFARVYKEPVVISLIVLFILLAIMEHDLYFIVLWAVFIVGWYGFKAAQIHKEVTSSEESETSQQDAQSDERENNNAQKQDAVSKAKSVDKNSKDKSQ